jgi:hypothetical protein
MLVSLHYPAGMRMAGHAYRENVASNKLDGRSMTTTR